jgi:hypothetical protein
VIIRGDEFVERPARGEYEQPDHQHDLADEGDRGELEGVETRPATVATTTG